MATVAFGIVYPAYAGMILLFPAQSMKFRSVPRVCGDDPRQIIQHSTRQFVYPAYAGMILTITASIFIGVGVPRVCGDDPLA